jgi:multidrug transporter EmrE-like cation transporter
MTTLSPNLIGTFFVSIVLQAAALSLLPITQGFSRPLPTIALIVLFVAGIGLLARIIATGVPLAVLAVGVTFYGEHASLLRVALLIAACGLIGVASIIR